ncbi:aldo/keto reductase [Luteolibacter soli]|uniref:Aldo/keto reductase n=1 Tax=Luteolibacter soli TaxID=3135280 RepID=A0ABU9AUZ2_9BACT
MHRTIHDFFSKLGLGTGTLASWRGGLSAAVAGRLLDVASDSGINLIDTADSYASGECERLLGLLLRDRRGRFSIITKVGYVSADVPGPLHLLNPLFKKLKHRLGARQDFRPDSMARRLQRSLQRLKSDHVDAFLLHDPPAHVLSDGSLFHELSKLKAAGLARRLGISSGDDEALQLALAWPDCDMIQTPLVEDGGLAPSLRAAKAGRPLIILNHVSLGGRLPIGCEPQSSALKKWRESIDTSATELGVSPQAALLRVALETTGADSVLTGTRDSGHLAENCRAVLS